MPEPLGIREVPAPSGRIFVIGDIHGCPLELELLLTHLEQVEKRNADDLIIFIGDYIDRGPDSNAVVERLIQLATAVPETIFLRGNHEEMLLGFLGLTRTVAPYLENGGAITFASYGNANAANKEDALSILPEAHLNFVKATERMLIVDNFLFVHAGINPLRSLEDQDDEDVYWIRDVFIQNIHRLEKMVIFGHTPFEDVLFHMPYKIGIDTGLVYGNALSCLELTEGIVLQVRAGSSSVSKRTFKDVVQSRRV